jgi:type I restriction enzyme M protein
MHWIVPSEKDADNAALEERLWDPADQFRANSGLKSQEYSGGLPQGLFLGRFILRFAEVRSAAQRDSMKKRVPRAGSDRSTSNP